MYKPSMKIIPKQLAMAHLLGVSVFMFQFQAQAADHPSLSGANIVIGDGDVVTADTLQDGYLNGVYVAKTTTADIDLGNGSKVISTGAKARGIVILGSNSQLKANALDVNVQSTGASALTTGLEITGTNADVDLGLGGSITATGMSKTYGINVSNGSKIKADQITISTEGTGLGFGISIQNGSTVNLGSDSFIKVKSDSNAYAVYLGGSGQERFEATKLTIETQGDYSYGIYSLSNNNAYINLGQGSHIITSGANANGVQIRSGGEFYADALQIDTSGFAAHAFSIEDQGIATIGAGSHINAIKGNGISASNGSTIDFNGTESNRNSITAGSVVGVSALSNATINLKYTDIETTTSGGTSWGIDASLNSTVNADHVNIKIAKSTSPYSIGVKAMGGSAVKLTGDTSIIMEDPLHSAIRVDGESTSGTYGPSSVTGNGKMMIVGNVLAYDDGTVNLKMSEGSYFSGAAYSSPIKNARVDIEMNESRWDMSQDSLVNKLALNNSTVDFTEDKTGSILSVGDLSGNGTFVMRINMVDDSADKLVVTGTSAGNHNVQVLNRGSLETTGNEVITIVETQDGAASFNLHNSRVNRAAAVELGGYQYNLRKNNTNWELFSSGKSAPITSTADTSANFLNVGYMLNYAETQTLLQRMGELRQTENSQGDVWVRAFTGKFDSFGGGKLSGFDMDYTGAQIGVDRKLNLTDGNVYLGVMGGTTKADSNYKEGNGDVKGYHFGVYGTYVTPNNFYVDGTLKYSHLKNSFDVKDSQYNQITGSASSDGYGLSVEVGQRFYLNAAKAGYYIEPQAQLSYLHQDSSSNTSSNGLLVDLDSYDSTLARASAIFGYEIKEGKNPVNVYVKTGYVAEMSGDVGYRLNGSPEKHDFGGGWWENGIGVTASINKKHNLYLDGTYATGSKFDQMQVNAGYRYSF